MCAHPKSAKREWFVRDRGHKRLRVYCRDCETERQRGRRQRSLREGFLMFATLPVPR